MKTNCVFVNKLIDRNRMEKTLYVTEVKPKVDSDNEQVIPGSIIMSSLADKAGVVLDMGEITNLIFALSKIREEHLSREYELNQKIIEEVERNNRWSK